MLIGTVRRAVASWWHGIPVATARGTVPTIFLRILSILSILSKTLRELWLSGGEILFIKIIA